MKKIKLKIWCAILITYSITGVLLLALGFYDIPYITYNIFQWVIAILFLPLPSMPIISAILLFHIEETKLLGG